MQPLYRAAVARKGTLGDTCPMREMSRTSLVARLPAVLYRLVDDIERYPEFVPGCTAAEVLERSAQQVIARLTVRRGLLRAQFTTRNRLQPEHSVQMQLVEGPFKVLEGSWQFSPVASNGCRVDFKLRFQFSNPCKSALLEPLFEQTQAELVRAFVNRAQSMPP
jgi:ribosome-associated toxin RatA of RatAB toxin-antitoxin module